MSAVVVEYAYRYLHPSGVGDAAGRPRLRLATSGGTGTNPYFFHGRLLRPRRTADLLRGLMEIVHARFHVPPNRLARVLALADPVVTSSEQRLRFEGFSGCCSAYARVDLLPEAVEGETVGRGTTNVDFNAPMLAALARIRDADPVELSVGGDEVRITRCGEATVEKKVALPLRWLKGFVEVQAYQARMEPVLEVPGLEALRFLRSLPRAKSKHPAWIVVSGRGLRLSHAHSSNGVCVAGLERLRVLESLAPHAEKLRLFRETASRTAAFELVLPGARFHLVLSPDVWRGFSGEGQALAALAGDEWKDALPRVRAALAWQSVIDARQVADRNGLPPEAVEAALAALGARGLVGYDLGPGAYFHRELPFDLSLLDEHQPRLQAARKLIEQGRVQAGTRTANEIDVFVGGSGVEHRVRITAEGARCTCPWFSRHQGQRGPCKHVLAAQMHLDPADD